MTRAELQALLARVAEGTLAPADALERLAHFPAESLDIATIDHHRALRQGQPEVIFCERKTVDQVVRIAGRLMNTLSVFELLSEYPAMRSEAAWLMPWPRAWT